MTVNPAPSLTQLRSLLGQTLNYRGQQAQIIDIINDGEIVTTQLVLQLPDSANQERSIQTDQFGDARRRTPETVTLRAFASDGNTLPAITQLLAKNAIRTTGG